MVHRPDLKDEPYCSNCGYRLTGLTESSKCPECGRPLVEVLVRNRYSGGPGRRWRSRAKLFGLPVIDIAIGPHGTELRGKARGIIAIGDVAMGGVAMGGVAGGVVAVGGMAIGGCAIGGMALGLLTAGGGLAIGGFAAGGGAVGILASGGGAAGIIAQGGAAIGCYFRDHRGVSSPEAADFFANLSWLFGPWPPQGSGTMMPLIVNGFITTITAALVAIPALIAVIRDNWEKEPQ